MESKGDFKEYAESRKNGEKINFFHLGPQNIWKENLKHEIALKIEKNFYKTMKELEYL